MSAKKTEHPTPSLSFKVIEIRQRIDGSTVFYDTILRLYAREEIITIRGRPFKIGSKVDFRLLKIEAP